MAKYLKKDIEIKQDRMLPNQTLSYGLMKTLRSDTPIPMPQKKLDASTLSERLQTMHQNISITNESEEGYRRESFFLESVPVDKMTFEMKRKLFDKAEFTITRGQKLSDIYHPVKSDINLDLNDPAQQTLEEIKAYCRQMNIKFSK
ncbi:uncharacterized protein LOC108044605 [Drosophila rhopaloa]|uniref:Uncharacterized protein n=1 Tax=Drosophila rhopaloa TaxID=1041015 RepID=A0ABM5J2G1_DRORH|nr:uncharacterized protein LOC108044605 [Drosophila rhopaloa]